MHEDNDVIVLVYSKDQLKNFVGSLGKIMSVIKAKTGKNFLPVVVQPNPMRQGEEMVIVMKASFRIDKFDLEHWFVQDETKLAKLF